MSIIDSILGRLGYARAAAPHSVGSHPQGVVGGLQYGTMPSAYPLTFPGWDPNGGIRAPQTTSDMAIASAWVASDLAVIAREMSTAELDVFTTDAAGNPTEDLNHAFANLWYAPNPFMGRSFIAQFQLYQLMLRGACYYFMSPLGNTIAELWPIPAQMIRPAGDDENFISGYRFQSRRDREPVIIPPEYIVYTRLPDPNDLRKGLPPIAAALGAVGLDAAQMQWNVEFFGEGNAVPSALGIVPKDTSEGEFLRVKAEVREFFTAGKRRIAVTRAGDLDFKVLTQTLKDMEFLRGREFNRDEIDRALGFPGGYWNANATEANARHAKAVLIEHVIWPLLTLIQEDINAQAMPRWYGDNVYVEFEDIRPRNVEMELRQQQTRQAYWTIDELREVDGMEPLPDARGVRLIAEPVGTGVANPQADPLAEIASKIDQLAQLIQQRDAEDVAEDSAEDTAEPPAQNELPNNTAPVQDDEDAAQIDEAKSVGDQLRNVPVGVASDLEDAPNGGDVGLHLDLVRWRKKALKAVKAGKPADVEFISSAIDAGSMVAISRGLRACETADNVRDVFLTADYRKAAPEGMSPDEKKLYDALVDILSKAGGAVAKKIKAGEPITWDDLDAQIKAALEPILREIMLANMDAAMAQVGVALGDGVAATSSSEWAKQYAGELIKNVSTVTQKLTQDTIGSYLANSTMTLGDVVAALSPAFGASRAEAIAITEVTNASAAGMTSYQTEVGKLGVKTMRISNTNEDDKVCPICKPLDGKPESEWPNVKGPSWHPRCRCFVTLKVIVE
jgi:HK97 family phage portal protein